MRKHVLVVCAALLAALFVPAVAHAVQITRHITKPVGHGQHFVTREVTYDVPPPDGDDDGVANADDRCPGVQGSVDYNGCLPPPPKPTPAPAPTTSTYSAPAPAPAPAPTTSSGGCPSYMAGEASSPTAVNPSSGASGCYQVLPSTAAAMGSACSDVNSSSCVAAICAASGNAAWASSGSTPCDYIKP